MTWFRYVYIGIYTHLSYFYILTRINSGLNLSIMHPKLNKIRFKTLLGRPNLLIFAVGNRVGIFKRRSLVPCPFDSIERYSYKCTIWQFWAEKKRLQKVAQHLKTINSLRVETRLRGTRFGEVIDCPSPPESIVAPLPPEFTQSLRWHWRGERKHWIVGWWGLSDRRNVARLRSQPEQSTALNQRIARHVKPAV